MTSNNQQVFQQILASIQKAQDQMISVEQSLAQLRNLICDHPASPRTFRSIFGVNIGKYVDDFDATLSDSTDTDPVELVVNSLVNEGENFDVSGKFRVFHLMEDDHEGRFPSEVQTSRDLLANWIYRYRRVAKKKYKIRVTLESIFSYRLDENRRRVEDSTSVRKFPDKSFTKAEWGGTDEAIKANAKHYMYQFLEHMRTEEGELLVGTIELGNEPWGQPGISAYKKIVEGAIDACIDRWGDDADDWPITLAHAAFQNSNPNGYWNSRTITSSDYLPDMVDESTLQYVREVTGHFYPFPRQTPGDATSSSNLFYLSMPPEVSKGYSRFQEFIDLANYAKDKGIKASITEFGWNSLVEKKFLRLVDGRPVIDTSTGRPEFISYYGVTPFAHAAYTIRALLLFARHGIDKAYIYEAVDNENVRPYCACGIYESLQGTRKPGNAKPLFHRMKEFMQAAGDMQFFEEVRYDEANHEDDDATTHHENEKLCVYKIGIAEPTHFVAWRPLNIRTWEQDRWKTFELFGRQVAVGAMPRVYPIREIGEVEVDG